mgnify:CR=1 FL=1
MAWIKFGLLLSIVIPGIFLVLLWQPECQVELHTSNLLKRASARHWEGVAAMVSPGYGDAWGHDRASAVEEMRQLFRHFFLLQIEPLEPLHVEVRSDVATASARMGVSGSGTAMAQTVMAEVDGLNRPFFFRWTKSGPWPWEWRLIEAGQQQLAEKYPR